MINESEIRLIAEKTASLKSLTGFEKHHRVPDKGKLIAPGFLIQISATDIEQDIDQTFSKIRKAFGFKRKQLTANEPLEGCGEIQTPGFRYEVSVDTIDGKPDQVLWRRAIASITDAESITGPEFEAVFGKQFNVLEVSLPNEIDIEDVIDSVEDCDDENVLVDYEKSATWCRIEFAGLARSIHVTPDRIQVRSSKEIAAEDLVSAFMEAHSQFFDSASSSTDE